MTSRLPSTLPRRGSLSPAPPQFKYWNFVEPEQREETIGTGHLHWGITAFSQLEDDGTMRDSVSVEVEAVSETQAISRAMEILEREHYRVSWVREACTADKDIKGA